MITITAQLDAAFRAAIRAAFDVDADPLIAPAQNEKFGDYQANAAMGLAKTLAERTGQKTNPRQVADQIKAKLSLGEMASETTIAGPGFINVRLSPAWLATQLATAAADDRLGVSAASTPVKTVVDYSGPNIAKEMHVGHLRSTIIGDALANVIDVLQPKLPVVRQSHIGDWGTQFGMLIAFLRRSDRPDAGALRIDDLESFYREAKTAFDGDPAFADAARKTVVQLQHGGADELAAWQGIVRETRRNYLPIYRRLSVKLNETNERGESFYNPLLPSVVADLVAADVAVSSEGATVVQVPAFESPLIVRKSDGGYLYGTTDLAAIRFRCGRPGDGLGAPLPAEPLAAQRVVYTHDSRQAQHFSQVFWTAERMNWNHGASLEYAPFGTMLGEDGKPFKTRAGGAVKLKDLLDEAERRGYELAKQKAAERESGLSDEQLQTIGRQIGIGAVKYADLSKDRTSDYVFSWEKMLAMEGNTGPYLQYVYARIGSIFRKAGVEKAAAAGAVRLESPFELALAKHILRLGEIIKSVARELKPHLLCAYLYDLAQRFSGFYENCPVLQSNEQTKASRLALCALTARTMAFGLDLLGIEHPEQM